jgi:hypothetical protein
VVVELDAHDFGSCMPTMTLSDSPYPPAARGHAEAGYEAAFDKLAALLAG